MLNLFSYPSPVPSLSLYLYSLHLPPFLCLWLWQPLKHWWVLEFWLTWTGVPEAVQEKQAPQESIKIWAVTKHFLTWIQKVFSLARAACAVLSNFYQRGSSQNHGNFLNMIDGRSKNIHDKLQRGTCWAGSGLPGCAFQIPFIAIGDRKHCRGETGLCGIF